MASYIGVSPPEQTGIVERYKYTGDGSATAFSGADTNAKVLRYTSTNPVLVFLNGVQLVEGTDFTKTSNTVLTFTSAPANNDEIEILTFGSFNLNSPATIRCDLGLNTTDSPTFNGLTSTGNINLGDDDVLNIGTGNDLQLYHDASNSYIKDAGTGDLRIEGSFVRLVDTSNSHTTATFASSGVNLRHTNNVKLTTVSSGIDVTGRGKFTGTSNTAGIYFDNSDFGTYDWEQYQNSLGQLIFTITGSGGAEMTLRNTNTASYTNAELFIGGSIVATTNNTLILSNKTLASPTITGDVAFDTDTLYVDSSNNRVGIGTTSPSEKLHIYGGDILFQGATPILKFQPTADSQKNKIDFALAAGTVQSSITGGGVDGQSLKFDTASNTRMTINSSGNVGIGTTNPGHLLHVESTGSASIMIRADSDNVDETHVPSLQMTSDGNTSDTYKIGIEGNAGTEFTGSLANAPYIHASNATSQPLQLANAGSMIMTLGDGKVGIGTSSPSTSLHISSGVITIDDGTDSHRLGNDGCQVFFGKDALVNNNQGVGNLAFGHEAMKANVSGCYNTAVGHQALTTNVSDAGSYNTAHGYQALYNNTTGEKNTAIGYHSMFANTTGEYNAAIGTDSLRANTTGEQNVALGHNSLYNNTFGNGQVAAGYKSLFNNTTGNYNVGLGAYNLECNTIGGCNVGIGYQALNKNTTASYGVAVGHQSAYSNTTGEFNIAIGYKALYANQTGMHSVAIGYEAGMCSPTTCRGVYVGYRAGCCDQSPGWGALTAVGMSAGQNHTTGFWNAFYGYTAGCSVTTGTSNTFVGSEAGRFVTTGAANVLIGQRAGYCLGTDGSSLGANVYIGTSTGLNGLCDSNTAVGRSALVAATTGRFNVAIGTNALACGTAGCDNTVVGSYSGCCLAGIWNAFLGAYSGKISTGTRNVFVGAMSGCSTTTGICNTVVGALAFKSNTTGVQNVAIGETALCSSISGTNNTAVGTASMRDNTSGANNVAVGKNALLSNTTGIRNTAIGVCTLHDNVSGTDNIAIGCGAMCGNTKQNRSIAIGTEALKCQARTDAQNTYNNGIGFNVMRHNVSGLTNDAIGGFSLFCMTNGSSNVAMGYQTGYEITTGANNTIIGALAAGSITTAQEVVAIGSQSLRCSTVSSITAVGAFAGQCNTTGIITAIGTRTLNKNTTGTCNVAIGYAAMCSNTTGLCNVAIGHETLKANTTGQGHTAVGQRALFNATTAICNTAIGFRALQTNTYGNWNTAIGANSLLLLTTGASNTAVGTDSGASLTIGASNTLIGTGSGNAITTGSNNIGLGQWSMLGQTDGSNNVALGNFSLQCSASSFNLVAVGHSALRNNVGSNNNTAIGFCSMFTNTTGDYNVSVGSFALCGNTTGRFNSAIGYQALKNNTIGSSNSSFGRQALTSNTTGSYNVALGDQTLFSNTTGFSNTAVGSHALCSTTTGACNTAVGHLALNLATTTTKNTAVGSCALQRTTAYGNTAIGGNASCGLTTGQRNVTMGYDANISNQTGSCNVIIGGAAMWQGTNSKNVALGYQAGSDTTSGSNLIVIGTQAQPSSATATNEITLGDANVNCFRIPGQKFFIKDNKLSFGQVESNTFTQVFNIVDPSNIPVMFHSTDADNFMVMSDTTGSIKFGTEDSGDFTMFTGGAAGASGGASATSYYAGGSSEVFRIKADGKIGIGTASPIQALTIAGGNNAKLAFTDGGVQSLYYYDGTPTLKGYFHYDHSSDQFRMNTTGSIALTGGNVGIGTTSPSSRLEVRKPLTSDTQSTPETVLKLSTLYNSTSANGVAGSGTRIEFEIPDDETNPITGAAIAGLKENDDDSVANAALAFYVSQNDTTLDEAMRINSTCQVLVGTTSVIHSNAKISANMPNTTGTVVALCRSGTTAGARQISFYNPNGEVGYICTNASSTNYNTSSDYRLKENVTYEFDATLRLKQLKPARFNFTTDTDRTVDGFLAHEVSNVVPEAISGEKDAVDENGNPEYQGIDQSKLVPLLVKAVQEQQTKIEELEAEITALKNQP